VANLLLTWQDIVQLSTGGGKQCLCRFGSWSILVPQEFGEAANTIHLQEEVVQGMKGVSAREGSWKRYAFSRGFRGA